MDKAIQILPFDGKQSSWRMWSQQFLARALLKKYKKILIGSIKAPKASEDEDKLSESDVEAREQNELAYTELLLSCKEVVCFGLIDESKTKDLPDGDAQLA